MVEKFTVSSIKPHCLHCIHKSNFNEQMPPQKRLAFSSYFSDRLPTKLISNMQRSHSMFKILHSLLFHFSLLETFVFHLRCAADKQPYGFRPVYRKKTKRSFSVIEITFQTISLLALKCYSNRKINSWMVTIWGIVGVTFVLYCVYSLNCIKEPEIYSA